MQPRSSSSLPQANNVPARQAHDSEAAPGISTVPVSWSPLVIVAVPSTARGPSSTSPGVSRPRARSSARATSMSSVAKKTNGSSPPWRHGQPNLGSRALESAKFVRDYEDRLTAEHRSPSRNRCF